MKRLAYSVALFLAATSLSFAQITKLEYGINFGPSVKVIDVDAGGNVYAAGVLVDNEDYGTFSLSSNGDRDVFVIKVSPTGTILWAVSYGGLEVDEIHALDVDADGDILLVGEFNDEVDFDPGSGDHILTANSDATDGYLLKLNSDGEFISAEVFGGTEYDAVTGVASDGASNIYLTGYFAGEVDFDPTTGDMLITATSTDAFFVKINNDGSFGWAKTVGNSDYANGYGATVDFTGTPIFTGHYGTDLDIDPGTGTETIVATGSGSDMFLVKLSPANGSYVWGKGFGTDGGAFANSVHADGQNNIYITGHFYGTGDFDPGTGTRTLTAANEFSDVFISKFHPSGALLWAHAIGGLGDDWAAGIYSDGSNVYVSGTFQQTVDFDPGTGVRNETELGDSDLFILKLDGAGAFKSVARIGGGSYEEGGAIVGDAAGNIYTSGYFYTLPLDVDPSGCVYNLDPEIAPSYLLKFGTTPPPCIVITSQPLPVTTCAGFTSTVTFTVAATGANLTYQWLAEEGEGDMDIITEGGSFSGTTTPTLTVNISALPSGYTRHFQVEIKGDASPTLLSNSVLLTLIPAPVVIPASRCGQGPVTLKVKTIAGVQFKWYTDAVGGTAIAGATGTSYTTPSLSATKTYYVSSDVGVCETPRVPITATIASCQPIPELAWAYSIGPNGQVLDMHIDRTSGTVYVVGSFSGTGDFDTGAGTTPLVGAGNSESFIAKYNTAGGLIWARNVGSSLQDVASSVAVDKDGNVLIAGYFLGTADLDPAAATTFNLVSAGSWDTYILKLNPDGNFLWAKRIGGVPTLGDIPSVIQTDAVGNVYVGGSFTGTVDMDPGTGVVNVTAQGDTDGLILKLDPNGNYISSTILRGPDFESVADLTLDAAGNIYAAGFFYDNTDFDPGAGTAIETGSNDQNAFALKLNPTGGLLWYKTFYAATTKQNGSSIALDSDGNVVVGGLFAGTIDLDPGPGTNMQTAANENAFAVKLDANGNYLWAKVVPSSNIGTGYAAVDGVDVYIFGSFVNTTDMDPGTGVFNQTSAGLTDSHIVKLNKDGDFQWAIQMGGTSTDDPTVMGFDNNENIYLGGWLSADGDYDPGPNIFNLVPASSTLAGSFLKFGPPTPVMAITTQPGSASACEGATVTFNIAATGAANIQYHWQKFDGSVFVDLVNGSGYSGVSTTALSINTTGNFGAGKYRCRVSGDGVTDIVSSEVDLTIVTTLTPPTTTAASRCGAGNVTVSASGSTNGNYKWYLTSSGPAITGEVNDSYTANISATTTFYVSAASGTCESTKTAVVATVNAVPATPTTMNITRCSGSTSALTASGGTAGGYRWYVVATGGTPISTDDSYNTPALTATVTYYVSSNNAGCESARAPLTITIQSCASNQPPVISTATSNTGIQGTTSINLMPLISDPDNNIDLTTLKIVVQPKSGATAVISQSGQLNIDYSNTVFAGEDELTIEVCDIAGSCARTVIKINVTGEMQVYNAVSPNGDGKNDVLFLEFIDVISSTKENKVTIYNRWGDVVFSVNNYNNTTNAFRGISNGGKELPSGTYYYKIEFSAGRVTEMGYLSLKR